MTDEDADHHLEQLIASACCVVGAGEEIGSITIVADRRLTYREFARLRERAAHCRVAVVMAGNGTVLVRRHGTMKRPPSVARLDGENDHGCGDSSSHGAR